MFIYCILITNKSDIKSKSGTELIKYESLISSVKLSNDLPYQTRRWGPECTSRIFTYIFTHELAVKYSSIWFFFPASSIV